MAKCLKYTPKIAYTYTCIFICATQFIILCVNVKQLDAAMGRGVKYRFRQWCAQYEYMTTNLFCPEFI